MTFSFLFLLLFFSNIEGGWGRDRSASPRDEVMKDRARSRSPNGGADDKYTSNASWCVLSFLFFFFFFLPLLCECAFFLP